MTRRIVLLVMCLGLSMLASEKNIATTASKTGSTEKIVADGESLPLKTRLIRVSQQLRIPLCLESGTASYRNTLGEKSLSLDEFLDVLKKSGYLCIKRKDAVLVSTADTRKMEGNPLDVQLDGFSFEGSHDEFINALFSKAPGTYPAVLKITGAVKKVHYELDIRKKTSIREILLQVSSLYGLFWYAEIKEKAPTFEMKNSDGSVQKVKGSRMTMYFQSVR